MVLLPIVLWVLPRLISFLLLIIYYAINFEQLSPSETTITLALRSTVLQWIKWNQSGLVIYGALNEYGLVMIFWRLQKDGEFHRFVPDLLYVWEKRFCERQTNRTDWYLQALEKEQYDFWILKSTSHFPTPHLCKKNSFRASELFEKKIFENVFSVFYRNQICAFWF